MDRKQNSPLYSSIYTMIREIPTGRVASYGQISGYLGCTARTVGFALAALPSGSDVPWQRVINSRGRISPRQDGEGNLLQRTLLETEGIHFGPDGSIDLLKYAWKKNRPTD